MTELGSTGMEITRVRFGAWAIGGGGFEWSWGLQEDDDSIAAIHHALELGVNWIDTAAQYGFGHSEEVVGPRDRRPRRAAAGSSRKADSPRGREERRSTTSRATGSGASSRAALRG